MSEDLEEKSKTGLDRFNEKYPGWPESYQTKDDVVLGVGAPMIDPKMLTKDKIYNRKGL
jgi:hypothetical protein